MILTLIKTLAVTTAFGWYASSTVLFLWIQFQNPPPNWILALRELRAELRPFYLPAAGIVLAVHIGNGEIGDWWTAFNDSCRFGLWFMYKDFDNDDDRWKRRKARLTEKIQRVGARLVVVPAGNSS
jgi:hypothetical protein